MTKLRRTLLAVGLAVAASAMASSSAAALRITPGGNFTLTSTQLQTFEFESLTQRFNCLWTLQGVLLLTDIELDIRLHPIGGISGAEIQCNEPVQIIALVGELGAGDWRIGFIPLPIGVLGLPTPTGVLVVLLRVRIRVIAGTFICLFTGSMGLLFSNGTRAVTLLGGQFRATPVLGDTCGEGLAATKGPGFLEVEPQWEIAP